MIDITVDDFLAHYGVKGQKWGVRKVSRVASKDAKESARAKAFYGKGAGTRRKLINQTVESRSKNVPGYKEAFQKHLDNQDMSKHVSKAVSERHRKDVKEHTSKTAGAVARQITGEMGTKAAFVALIAGGAVFLKSNKGQSMMKGAASKISDVKNQAKAKKGAQAAAAFLRKNGM